jgi:hypothetical protein
MNTHIQKKSILHITRNSKGAIVLLLWLRLKLTGEVGPTARSGQPPLLLILWLSLARRRSLEYDFEEEGGSVSLVVAVVVEGKKWVGLRLEEGVRIEIVVANMFFSNVVVLFHCFVPVRDSSSPNKIGFFVEWIDSLFRYQT